MKRNLHHHRLSYGDDDKENSLAAGNKKVVFTRKKSKIPQSSPPPLEDPDLASKFECPICLHCYDHVIYVCSNGHSVCKTCYEKIEPKRCPSCRVPLTGARNQALEAVASHTILPCRHKEYGCDFKGRGLARANHRNSCVFRPIRCLFHRCYPQCKWHGPPSALLKHLNTHCMVRKIKQDQPCDVYWSYETKERCWQRGKDATFFSHDYNRFYYMSISRRGEHYHLASVWLPTTVKAAESPTLQMEVSIPLEDDEFVTYTLKPPRLDPSLMMDGNVKRLIDQGKSFIIPIKKWRYPHPIFSEAWLLYLDYG
eukprot:jgi/Bigna1/127627/aug1.5_g2335